MTSNIDEEIFKLFYTTEMDDNSVGTRISGQFVRLQALAFFVENAVKTVYRTDSEIMVKCLLTLGIVIDNILTHSIS